MSTQPSTGPSTSTPEYLAFQECYETLILTVKLQPGAFCDSLFARRYIPEAVRDYTRNESNLAEMKAEKLCDSVIDQIKHDPSVFYGFIEILKSRFIDKIADKLHQCCCDNSKTRYDSSLEKSNKAGYRGCNTETHYQSVHHSHSRAKESNGMLFNLVCPHFN